MPPTQNIPGFRRILAGLAAALAFAAPRTVIADTVIAQKGPNPLVFHQAPSSYNGITYLMCYGAERNSGLIYDSTSSIASWDDTTTDYIQWTVSVPATATYRIFALINGPAAATYRVTVVSNGAALNFTQGVAGWNKVDAGSLTIPAGTQKLKLVRTSTGSSCKFRSLEVIKDTDYTQIASRAASFKKDTSWFSHAKYGLMFQYGAWGYPQSGARKSLDAQAADFNVTNFVNMVKATGASYVIWSVSWWDYLIDAPIAEVDSIMGNSSLTASRDLIGDVANALQAAGIRFGLYYHMGVNQNAAWRAKNESADWPSVFDYGTSMGNRTTFFANQKSVITALGNRYGTKLDLFFFDCGSTYYAGPMEDFANAARAGNSNRLISFNTSWTPRLTEFQDVDFGELSHGESTTGSAAAGGNGIYTTGMMKGMLQHGMFMMEQDWGVHAANTPINTGITSTQAISWVKSAMPRRVPLSFNMMMWEDGTIASASRSVLTALKNAIHGTGSLTNSTAIGTKYTGAWSISLDRGVGDYNNDVHYTATNNDTMEFTFAGTGIDYITEKNSDMGNVDVYIDNVFQATVSCSNSTRLAQQTVYSKTALASGTHTIRLVKKSGTFMLVDAFRIAP